MCCGSSFGPDRYGPIYNGRYSFLGAQPARSPWLENPEKIDPSCPFCRIGAYQPSDRTPPVPFSQKAMAPAGQGMIGRGLGVGVIEPGPGVEMAAPPYQYQTAYPYTTPLQYAPPVMQPVAAYSWPMNLVPTLRLR